MGDATETPDECLVCGADWRGTWTDKHCQMVCLECGAPHQIKHDMLPDGEEAPQVTLKDWARQALKEYHEETGERAPIGTFISDDYNGKPYFGEEIDAFNEWIDEHDDYPPEDDQE